MDFSVLKTVKNVIVVAVNRILGAKDDTVLNGVIYTEKIGVQVDLLKLVSCAAFDFRAINSVLILEVVKLANYSVLSRLNVVVSIINGMV